MSENSGLNSNEIVPKLISANNGDVAKGLNIFTGEAVPISELNVYDHRYTKEWAIRLAS